MRQQLAGAIAPRPRVYLRPLQACDLPQFLAAARASRALHAPWVCAPGTPRQFQAYLARMTRPDNRALLVCMRGTLELGGVINISNIVRGAFRSGYLGYYAFSGFEHRGLMREGLRLAIRQAFGALKLHRLEANIQPGNARSIALVRGLGFRLEGYSPRYLKINGRWRDHERWAILAS